MILSFNTTPKMLAGIFAALLAMLLFCAYKVNTTPSGIALTGYIFACSALVVLALFTKIDLVFHALRDELKPKTGGTASGSVNSIEPCRQRTQREDLLQSLVCTLSPQIVNGMTAAELGGFIRNTADSILGTGQISGKHKCLVHGSGICSCALSQGSSTQVMGDLRIQAAKDGLTESADRAAKAWRELNGVAPTTSSAQALKDWAAPIAAYEARQSGCFSVTSGDEVDRMAAAELGLQTMSQLVAEKWAGAIAAAGRATVGCTEPHLCSAGAQADQRAEAEIVAKGLTAPRVTAEQIQALMAKLTWHYEQPKGTTSTFAHAYLGRFFLTTGHSACVSPENFDAALGMKYAREQAEGKAREKLWELEGYVLYSFPQLAHSRTAVA